MADLIGLPEIVIMVGFGVLIGPSALDIAEAPIGSVGVELGPTVGVGFILFYGGLSLSLHVLRTVSVGLTLLVLPGVLLTALVTGLAAALVFGLPADAAFLMGAVLAPTDPAILIPLFSRMRIRPRVAQTVIAESAFNDPTGAILALAIAGVVVTGHASVTSELVSFVRNLASSAAVGLVVALRLAATVSSRRVGIWRGVARHRCARRRRRGLFLPRDDRWQRLPRRVHRRAHRRQHGHLRARDEPASRTPAHELRLERGRHRHDARVHHAGRNLPLEDIWKHLWAGLAVLGVFILVARPLAVLVCTYPDRRAGWTSSEKVFLCWTRETGVVPAALAGILLQTNVPHARLIASVVALAIVASSLTQATTAAWLAGRLGLIEPEWTSDTLERAPVAGNT